MPAALADGRLALSSKIGDHEQGPPLSALSVRMMALDSSGMQPGVVNRDVACSK